MRWAPKGLSLLFIKSRTETNKLFFETMTQMNRNCPFSFGIATKIVMISRYYSVSSWSIGILELLMDSYRHCQGKIGFLLYQIGTMLEQVNCCPGNDNIEDLKMILRIDVIKNDLNLYLSMFQIVFVDRSWRWAWPWQWNEFSPTVFYR